MLLSEGYFQLHIRMNDIGPNPENKRSFCAGCRKTRMICRHRKNNITIFSPSVLSLPPSLFLFSLFDTFDARNY